MARPACSPLSSLLLLLALLGCDRKAPEPSPDPAEPELEAVEAPQPSPAPEPPAYLVVAWGSRLHTAPSHGSLKINLPTLEGERLEQAGPGALFKVAGVADEAGKWWKLETLPEASGAPAPLAGFGFYALTVYVPAGLGEAGEAPGPPPSPPPQANPETDSPLPLQVGGDGPAGGLYRVEPGAMVFWPDGSIAGEVREAHGFGRPGEERTLQGVLATCFPIRYAPGQDERPKTELCFERSDVLAPDPDAPAPVP